MQYIKTGITPIPFCEACLQVSHFQKLQKHFYFFAPLHQSARKGLFKVAPCISFVTIWQVCLKLPDVWCSVWNPHLHLLLGLLLLSFVSLVLNSGLLLLTEITHKLSFCLWFFFFCPLSLWSPSWDPSPCSSTWVSLSFFIVCGCFP